MFLLSTGQHTVVRQGVSEASSELPVLHHRAASWPRLQVLVHVVDRLHALAQLLDRVPGHRRRRVVAQDQPRQHDRRRRHGGGQQRHAPVVQQRHVRQVVRQGPDQRRRRALLLLVLRVPQEVVDERVGRVPAQAVTKRRHQLALRVEGLAPGAPDICGDGVGVDPPRGLPVLVPGRGEDGRGAQEEELALAAMDHPGREEAVDVGDGAVQRPRGEVVVPGEVVHLLDEGGAVDHHHAPRLRVAEVVRRGPLRGFFLHDPERGVDAGIVLAAALLLLRPLLGRRRLDGDRVARNKQRWNSRRRTDQVAAAGRER
jgi:hypothetical protein